MLCCLPFLQIRQRLAPGPKKVNAGHWTPSGATATENNRYADADWGAFLHQRDQLAKAVARMAWGQLAASQGRPAVALSCSLLGARAMRFATTVSLVRTEPAYG